MKEQVQKLYRLSIEEYFQPLNQDSSWDLFRSQRVSKTTLIKYMCKHELNSQRPEPTRSRSGYKHETLHIYNSKGNCVCWG